MTDTPTYHWTPASQRGFLECLAETGSVAQACASVSMSRRSAYNLRFRKDGAAFRLGWEAAILMARDCLADELLARAIDGVREESERNPETGRMVKIKTDSRLGMSVLARLDKMAEAGGPATHARARIASQDFAGFLDLVEDGGDADDVEAFVHENAPQCELAPKSAENAAPRATQKQLSEMAAIITHGEPMPEAAFPNIRNRADRRRLAAIMAKRGNHGLADRFAAG